MRDPRGLELPGCEPRALQERPRLVDEHALEEAALPRGAERADRGAVAAGREPACVAMRQGACAGPKSSAACAAIRLQRSTSSPWSARARAGVGSSRIRVERPEEIDGGGPRRRKRPLGRAEILSAERRERQPVRRGDADRGRAANRERRDRRRDLGGGGALELDDRVWQPPLVEEDDPRGVALLQPNDLLGG